jgi:hypothetical protein
MLCEYGCGNEATHKFKSGKWCCNNNTARCPSMRKKNSESTKLSHKNGRLNKSKIRKVNCIFCKEKIALSMIKRHKDVCYLNPKNIRLCPVCNKPIKKYGKTCSRECRLEYFGAPNKYSLNELKSYTAICFRVHKKECIICGEKNIVSVHHYDENKKNNDPVNLIPLCLTHHMYLHSRYKYLVIERVLEFIEKFKTYYYKEFKTNMWE